MSVDDQGQYESWYEEKFESEADYWVENVDISGAMSWLEVLTNEDFKGLCELHGSPYRALILGYLHSGVGINSNLGTPMERFNNHMWKQYVDAYDKPLCWDD